MNNNSTKNSIIKQCEMCGENATNICFKCIMYLCDSCDKAIHNMKLSKQHKKEKIDFFVPIDLRCPQHKLSPMNLFCANEKGNYFILIHYYFNL